MKREIMNFEKNRVPEIDISWDVITAYPKHESCMDAKQKVWQRRLKQIQDEKEQNQRSVEIKSVPYDGISKTYKGKDGDSLILMSWSEQFLCLPSSLDPREKSSR